MSDDLIKPKLYGIGQNYQRKMGFPKGLNGTFAPKSEETIRMSEMEPGCGKAEPAIFKKRY